MGVATSVRLIVPRQQVSELSIGLGWAKVRCGAAFGMLISCLFTHLNVSNSQMIMSGKYTFLCMFAFDIIMTTAVADLMSITGY